MARRAYDGVVVGSGPNGLAAAIVLARAGRSVLVLERAETVGGGARTAGLTLPGYHHDICSAIHPMAAASPLFAELPLDSFGLRWRHASSPLAHPLEDGTAAVLHRSLAATAERLGRDGPAWTSLVQPFVDRADALFADVLSPVRLPRHPLLMGRFGLVALRSCAGLVRGHFQTEPARSLFAGSWRRSRDVRILGRTKRLGKAPDLAPRRRWVQSSGRRSYCFRRGKFGQLAG